MMAAIFCDFRSNFMFFNKQVECVISHHAMNIICPVTLIIVIISWQAWLYQLQFDSSPFSIQIYFKIKALQ